jgi:sulfur carrier protein
VKVAVPDRRDELKTVFPGHRSGHIGYGFFNSVNVQINGKRKEIADGLTIARLLEELQIRPGRVVIELNREIISREAYEKTFLNEGDAIEIVHFVGGG